MNNSSGIFTFSVDSEDEGIRLDVFLARQLGLSRSQVKSFIDNGFAVLQSGKVLKASYPVEEGNYISISVPPRGEPDFIPEDIPLDIIFSDAHIAVINKPPGMVVHPGRGNITGTLASALLHYCCAVSGVGDTLRPGIVHRLDKDTSGLIVVALNDRSYAMLSAMIRSREISRYYTAFVWGHPDPPNGTIDAPIGRHPHKRTLFTVLRNGKTAVTHYETTAVYEFLSKLKIRLETGRTHQIRVHMAHIGHHVFGDPVYGGREERLKGFSPEVRAKARQLLTKLNRQALHAEQLEFRHPVTDEKLLFEVPLPEDLRLLQRSLDM